MNKETLKEKISLEKLEKLSADLEKKPLLDRIMGKAISRKFLTFVVATVLMCVSELDSDTWGMIAMIYIGSQSAIDLALAWRHGPE